MHKNIFYFLVTQVLAQKNDLGGIIPDAPNSSIPDTGEKMMGGIFQSVVDIIFSIAGGIALAVMIYLGYQLFTSRGKEDEFSKTMKGLVYTAIGLSVLGLSYAIVRSLLTVNL